MEKHAINRQVFSLTLDVLRMFGDSIPNKVYADTFRSVFDTIKSGVDEHLKKSNERIRWINITDTTN